MAADPIADFPALRALVRVAGTVHTWSAVSIYLFGRRRRSERAYAA